MALGKEGYGLAWLVTVSDREAGAAAARCLRVWIVHLEGSTDQFLDIVEFGTFEERQGNRIDQDGRAGFFDDLFFGICFVNDV